MLHYVSASSQGFLFLPPFKAFTLSKFALDCAQLHYKLTCAEAAENSALQGAATIHQLETSRCHELAEWEEERVVTRDYKNVVLQAHVWACHATFQLHSPFPLLLWSLCSRKPISIKSLAPPISLCCQAPALLCCFPVVCSRTYPVAHMYPSQVRESNLTYTRSKQ